MKKGKVLLITGPAGSGKSTLADSVSKLPGWSQISEDKHWEQHGWSGHRSEEQERIVQQEVSEDLRKLSQAGKNIVLEFILYKKPPNPLTNYIDHLRKIGVDYEVVALKPDINTIVNQIKRRGRPSDLSDIENRKLYAINQIACLEDASINPSWIVNPSGLSSEKVFEAVKKRITT